jgi:hypothetical protein
MISNIFFTFKNDNLEGAVAQIQISLSQDVVNANRQLAQLIVKPSNGLVGAAFDALISVGSAVARSYVDYDKATLDGANLTLTFSDGATIVYRNLVFANPAAESGLMQASQFEFARDGVLEFSQAGAFTLVYQYLAIGGGSSTLAMASLGGTAQGARLVSDYPADSPRYNPYLGNVGMAMVGTVGSDSAGQLLGRVTEVQHWADKLFKSISVKGELALSGEHAAVSNGSGHAAVGGTVESYAKEYYDGSYERYAGLALALQPGEQFELAGMLGDASRFPGDDSIDLRLPQDLGGALQVMAGAGNDRISLSGGAGVGVHGGAGNDRIFSGRGDRAIEGGPGTDTVQYAGLRADTVVQGLGSVLAVHKAQQSGYDVLSEVERIEWGDSAIAFDIGGVAGQAYRIYQAAFDRQPDIAGLSFWLHQMDKGVPLYDVAAGFVASAEFRALYGAAAGDSAFLTRLYQNVLHRPYDQAGFDFWLEALAKGYGREVILAQFSESPENQAQVIGAIRNGIDYLPMAELQLPVV